MAGYFSKRKNIIHKHLHKGNDLDIEEISFEADSSSFLIRLRPIIVFTLFLISIFLFSMIIVWYTSTDLQRQQTNLFIQQAIQGNVDFSILAGTQYDALRQIKWFQESDSKTEAEYSAQLINSTATAKLANHSTNNKYKNLYSCTNKAAIQLKKKKLYSWRDADNQLHMSDRFPKTRDYKNLSIKDLKSEHFFELNLNKRYSRLPAFASDRMKRDINQIYKILTHRVGVSQLNPIRLNLKLYDSKPQFIAYKKTVAPQMGNAGGFYISRLNEAVVYTGNNDQRMYNVSRHEAVHAINNGAFGRMPTWLNEGMAEYFENLEFEKSMLRIVQLNQAHLQLLSKKSLPSLRSYLNMNAEQWYQESSKDVHYAMAWSLMYFLMDSEKGKQFLKYMLDHIALNYCQSISSIDYINKNYAGGLKRFHYNWKRWLAANKREHRY